MPGLFALAGNCVGMIRACVTTNYMSYMYINDIHMSFMCI